MVIQIQDLAKRYGDVVAVDGPSFEVERGEIFGLLGPNGAGKTTTIRIIMDILHPDAGSVTVLGQPPNQAKANVGYLPEERGLFRNLKVLGTLVYLGELKGVPRSVARERAVALLAVAGAASIPARVLILGAVYYVLGYALYSILMASVGALGTTTQESQKLAGVFSFFAAVPYMLSGFLFANPNMTLARALSYFPLTAPTMMMLRLPLAEVPWVDVVISIVVLLLSIPAALWAGSKLFQVGLLIYGKRPTLREIWLILRSK